MTVAQLEMAETKRRTYPTKPAFGETAPSNTIPFPQRANMTVAEILAFLPNSINCADVIYRMVSNGGTRRTIHAVINTHRDFEAEWSANCCGEAMYKTMNKAGYTNWTIKKHDLWHADRKTSWDGHRLDVGGFRTASTGMPVETVSFRSLAENVRTLPEGDDALDLTRMIQYCVQNREDHWNYPKDYDELLELLGGAAEIREQNTDGAVFGRWENRKAPPPSPRSTQPSADAELANEPRQARRQTSDPRGKSDREGRLRATLSGPGSLMQRKGSREKDRVRAGTDVERERMEPLIIYEKIGTPYQRGLVSADIAIA